jgi:hypothetical protein
MLDPVGPLRSSDRQQMRYRVGVPSGASDTQLVRVVAPHEQKRGKREIKRRKVAFLQGAHSQQAALATTWNNEAAHFSSSKGRADERLVATGQEGRDPNDRTPDFRFPAVKSGVPPPCVSRPRGPPFSRRIVVSWYSCPARRHQSSCDPFAALMDSVAERKCDDRASFCHSVGA